MQKEESSCGSCSDSACSARQKKPNERPKEFEDRQALARRLCRIKHKILVLSGKGGVGKSTVAVNLAASLAVAGHSVGLMDVDIHGPSVPTLLNLTRERISFTEGAMLPIDVGLLKVMSIGFLVEKPEDAVIWRGPMKMGVIQQFLKDVEWGDLDYLVVDSPPGTGDEPLSVCQLIEKLDGAVIVTTPQDVAVADVRRSVTFCRQLGVPVLGILENMSGLVCPGCGLGIDLFGRGGGEKLAREMKVPFLGRIPLDPRITSSGDLGMPFVQRFPDSPTSAAFGAIVASICEETFAGEPAVRPTPAADAGRTEDKHFGRMNDPTAAASVKGPCGDTMEFYLDVRDGVIREALYHTDGCAETRRCGSAVAAWIEGRTVPDALAVNARLIMDRLPDLPDGHKHCPILAVSAFYRAVGEYLLMP